MDWTPQQEDLSLRILHNCRNELCDLFPYLDGAFACFSYKSHQEPVFFTDGTALCYCPPKLLQLYGSDPTAVRRGYLHCLLHCLFLHVFRAAQPSELWDLACDMAVEHLMELQQHPRLSRSQDPVASRCFAILGSKALPAEHILSMLQEGRFPFSVPQLQQAFAFDVHTDWSACRGSRSQWEEILKSAGQAQQGMGHRRGTSAGTQEEETEEQPASEYDYHKFLRRFTVSREEMELDTESFDYIFYHLGMEYYGSMPLIEHLESKEVSRLEELVIAIDTSGSCSRQTVSQFLAETYRLLSQRENFFRKMKVYFLQCDCVIQDVALIRSKEDWLSYSKKLKIQGRGGTDFRPVFDYVKKLQAEKELKNLKAILYFTDGDGIYPTKPPETETAFVFTKETDRMDLAPAWAKKLLIPTQKERRA